MLKTATLSTHLACPSFSELQLMAVPILRVAVEPTKHSDLPALVRGLKLLNQADACVQVKWHSVNISNFKYYSESIPTLLCYSK